MVFEQYDLDCPKLFWTHRRTRHERIEEIFRENADENAPSEIILSVVLAYLRLQHTHWAYLKENLQFIALQNRTPPITKIMCVKNARAWFHI